MTVPVPGGDTGGDGSGRLCSRRASKPAPLQSCLELRETSVSRPQLNSLSVNAESKLLGLHPPVSMATPASISPRSARTAALAPVPCVEASAFCFVRGIGIAQMCLFVTKTYAAESDAHCELCFPMITFY